MAYREINPDNQSTDAKRHSLDKLGPVDFGDTDGTYSRLRRQLRNPSLLTFIILTIIALSVPAAILFPSFYSGAKEGIVLIRREPVTHFLQASTPSWINPYLQRQISTMQNAELPIEWRGVSFVHGPCFEQNLQQLPAGKYSDGIARACADLHEIQMSYASSCATTNNCNIPTVAVERLQAVRTDLIEVFSDAYSDYSLTEEQPSQ